MTSSWATGPPCSSLPTLGLRCPPLWGLPSRPDSAPLPTWRSMQQPFWQPRWASCTCRYAASLLTTKPSGQLGHSPSLLDVAFRGCPHLLGHHARLLVGFLSHCLPVVVLLATRGTATSWPARHVRDVKRQPERSRCVEGQTLPVKPPICAGLSVLGKVPQPVPASDMPAWLPAKHWYQGCCRRNAADCGYSWNQCTNR